MQATLGGLTFVGDGAAGTYTIAKDGLKGWWGGVEMRREIIPRPIGVGDFPAPGRLGSRLITLTGLILVDDDDASYEAALADLETLLDDGSMATLTVTQATGTYTISVGRSGAPDIAHEVYGSVARYQLQLWAPLPAKVVVP